MILALALATVATACGNTTERATSLTATQVTSTPSSPSPTPTVTPSLLLPDGLVLRYTADVFPCGEGFPVLLAYEHGRVLSSGNDPWVEACPGPLMQPPRQGRMYVLPATAIKGLLADLRRLGLFAQPYWSPIPSDLPTPQSEGRIEMAARDGSDIVEVFLDGPLDPLDPVFERLRGFIAGLPQGVPYTSDVYVAVVADFIGEPSVMPEAWPFPRTSPENLVGASLHQRSDLEPLVSRYLPFDYAFLRAPDGKRIYTFFWRLAYPHEIATGVADR